MLKLLIADDEQIILDGISESIDWGSYGIEVAGTATNGVDALEMAKRHCVDILITDIKMPGLGGLELIKEINGLKRGIRVLLISAYEQFDFAQEAITLGALSYLTKPLKKQKIIDEVLKTRDGILAERQDADNRNILEEQYRENLPIIREHYLNNLILGRTSMGSDFGKQFETYGIELAEAAMGVFVFTADDIGESGEEGFEKGAQIIYLQISHMIRELLPACYKSVVFQSHNNEVVTIYNSQEPLSDTIRDITSCAEEIKNKIRHETGISVSAGVGRTYSSVGDAALSYREALKALNYRLVYGNNAVLYIDYVEIKELKHTNVFNNLNEMLTNIQNVLWTGRYDEVIKLIDKIMSGVLNNKGIPYHYIQQVYCQLLSVLLRTIYEMNIMPEQLYGTSVHLYSELLKKSTFREVDLWYRDLIGRACTAINSKKAVRTNNVISGAIKYIKENCSRDLSLSEVADKVNLNPSYFSRLFKEETGTQFVEYVRNIKMDLAKELLKNSNKKIYEICEDLGYLNVQYFSTVFKNTVGMTPNEYKKSGKF
jgi:two-component system, response regulator YesN